ncbi:uncharacterized protein LOC142986551 [Anticarsia gemmatalis]|uniref:uncharacterized protein LOC142986551 n=1 Tax=Anticarsia gemmatalis TaxID=129554 RepID=UPI003F759BFE
MKELTLATVSKYLTEDVIDKVFKLKTASEDNVKSVEVTRAAAAGEGMISGVYRIKVTGSHHTANFVAKGLVQDTLLRKSLKCCLNFFEREILFFSEILPVFKQIQNDLGAKERLQDSLPVCYAYHVDGCNDYIVMEDLSDRKFQSISETPELNERDTILKVLAHFHAVSMALRLKKPELFNKITGLIPELYYNEDNRDWYAKYLQSAINIDKNVIAEKEDNNSIYFKRFEEALKDDVYGQLIELVETPGDHPIVNHGDAWCPNFLFSGGKAIVIDFQILRCASLATDLSYFIVMSSNLCRTKEDFYEAVNIYYKGIEYYLTDMGLDPDVVFSFETLKNELKRFGKFGLLAALTSIPLTSNERCDVLQSFDVKYSGYDKIPLEELWQLSPITSEKHKMRLVNAVRVAVDVGLI